MSGSVLQVIILALIQGLTEFLPVSSSGHLVIAEALMGTDDPSGAGSIIFEVAVHVGTLGAVAVVYRKKIYEVLESLAGWLASGLRMTPGNSEGVRYAGWIVAGSIPAAVVALAFRDRIESLFGEPSIASALLVVTGVLLYSSRDRRGVRGLDMRTVILIGVAQAVAILPGCSRSGWTISVALIAGVGFGTAAEFSFLLSIPAILGALLLELAGGSIIYTGSSIFLLATGTATAFVAGLAALRLLIYLLGRGSFYRFSWYLVPAGTLSLLYFLRTG